VGSVGCGRGGLADVAFLYQLNRDTLVFLRRLSHRLYMNPYAHSLSHSSESSSVTAEMRYFDAARQAGSPSSPAASLAVHLSVLVVP
jgi:hypothetical protein